MKIGCLAWGSLVWDPRTLPVAAPFREDGPSLPIEFSRISLDGRVTLVINPAAPLLRSLWAPLVAQSLEEAIEALGRREMIVPERWADWVGRRSRQLPETPSGILHGIDDWLAQHSLDAVVWTALPSRGPDGRQNVPKLETLLEYLESLSGETRERAEQYVRRTPRVVRTPHRARFEAELGWHPADG